MEPAPIPEDEAERIAALWALGLLDTDSENRFDRLTDLATRVLGVPISTVSLVDRDRQWFKSCVGLDVPETGRDVSFCGHAVAADRPLVVNDARLDPRFADNPLVTGPPHIRFYAGVPVHAPTPGTRSARSASSTPSRVTSPPTTGRSCAASRSSSRTSSP